MRRIIAPLFLMPVLALVAPTDEAKKISPARNSDTYTITASTIPMIASGATVSVRPLFAGLIAYYPLSGNSKDESGNGLDAAVHGATLTRDRQGQYNCAYHFNRTDNDYIEVADNPLLHVGKGQHLTISIWVKTSLSDAQTFISKYRSVPPRGGFYLGMNENGYPYFAGRDRYDARMSGPASVRINDGTWHLVTGMRQATVWSIWVDSELSSSADVGSDAAMDNDERLIIGSHIDMGQQAEYVTGDLDEICIYSRALTAAEVKTLYGSAKYSKSVSPSVQTSSNYTLESAHKKVTDYIKVRDKLTDYARDKKDKELIDSLVGSTININYIVVDSTWIQVKDGKSYISVDIDDGYKALKYLKWNIYFPYGVYLKLVENADRMAMEIVGEQAIKVIGRITSASPERFILSIDIISWSKI